MDRELISSRMTRLTYPHLPGKPPRPSPKTSPVWAGNPSGIPEARRFATSSAMFPVWRMIHPRQLPMVRPILRLTRIREQSFDAESPATGDIKEMVSGTDATRTGTPGEHSQGKLDTVLHRVEGRENFWDISRMYYDSGRYYRALWKANSDKVPDIAKLYQGTIIRIPPPEDLDPVYIDPPGKRTGSNRTDGEILAGHEIQADDHAPADPIPPPPTGRPATFLRMVAPSATPDAWVSS